MVKRYKRGSFNCHLNEKAEEDQKEAKEVAVLFNASTVGRWYHVTRQRSLHAACLLLNHS